MAQSRFFLRIDEVGYLRFLIVVYVGFLPSAVYARRSAGGRS